MLPQLALLMAFQLAGEAAVKVLEIPFPGPLCGMLLLLGYLHFKGGPSDALGSVGSALVDHLGLLFVPAGTAIITYTALLAREGLSIMMAILVSTTVAVVIGGVVAQRLMQHRQPA